MIGELDKVNEDFRTAAWQELNVRTKQGIPQ